MAPSPGEFFLDLFEFTFLMIPRLPGLIAPLFDPAVMGPLFGVFR